MRPIASVLLTILLATPGWPQQEPPKPETPQKYKLTVVENASRAKRVKKNRVSAEAVVKVTDENDIPIAGIAVTFTIPNLAGGATFATGSFTSVVTTNAVGLASSGSFVTGTSTAFSMSAVASIPGGTISAAIPVNTAAAIAGAGAGAGGAGAGAAGGAAGGTAAGVSTGLVVGIVAGVAAVGAVVAKVATGGGSSSPTSNPPNRPSATIGVGSGPTFGGPR